MTHSERTCNIIVTLMTVFERFHFILRNILNIPSQKTLPHLPCGVAKKQRGPSFGWLVTGLLTVVQAAEARLALTRCRRDIVPVAWEGRFKGATPKTAGPLAFALSSELCTATRLPDNRL